MKRSKSDVKQTGPKQGNAKSPVTGPSELALGKTQNYAPPAPAPSKQQLAADSFAIPKATAAAASGKKLALATVSLGVETSNAAIQSKQE